MVFSLHMLVKGRDRENTSGNSWSRGHNSKAASLRVVPTTVIPISGATGLFMIFMIIIPIVVVLELLNYKLEPLDDLGRGQLDIKCADNDIKRSTILLCV